MFYLWKDFRFLEQRVLLFDVFLGHMCLEQTAARRGSKAFSNSASSGKTCVRRAVGRLEKTMGKKKHQSHFWQHNNGKGKVIFQKDWELLVVSNKVLAYLEGILIDNDTPKNAYPNSLFTEIFCKLRPDSSANLQNLQRYPQSSPRV